MYNVNKAQINARLLVIPDLAEAMQSLSAKWEGSMLEGLAQERALHLAIEIITDVGNYLIDGFVMRDASSYEDILEITGEEGVYPKELEATFIELVKLRRPLVQEYHNWQRAELHAMTPELSQQLLIFKSSVEDYIRLNE